MNLPSPEKDYTTDGAGLLVKKNTNLDREECENIFFFVDHLEKCVHRNSISDYKNIDFI